MIRNGFKFKKTKTYLSLIQNHKDDQIKNLGSNYSLDQFQALYINMLDEKMEKLEVSLKLLDILLP